MAAANRLSSVFGEKSSGAYPKPVKVKVVATEEATSYRGTDGLQKQLKCVAISDGEKVVVMKTYDPSKFLKLVVGNTLVLRDIVKRTEDTLPVVVVTKVTKVFLSTPLEVPHDHEVEGQRLLNPPPTPQVPISKALASPVKMKNFISGKIVQEDEPKQLTVRGEEVKMKTVTVEDGTGKVKVTLWREAAEAAVRPGDHVTISDVVINVYNKVTNLQTTFKSRVERTEAPLETLQVTVEGVCVENGEAELLLDDESSLTVPAETLQQALGLNDIEMATSDGPVSLNIQRRGADVLSVSRID